MVSFGKKVLFVGYGSVAQCTLPILIKHLNVPLANVTVMDFEDQAGLLKEWTAKGVNFVRDKITPRNMESVIAKYLGAGDILIDLAWNIDCCEIVQLCHDRGSHVLEHVGRGLGSVRSQALRTSYVAAHCIGDI